MCFCWCLVRGYEDIPATIPSRSTTALLRSVTEKASSTQGKYGAVKLKRPRKFRCTYGCRLPHTYTCSMTTSEATLKIVSHDTDDMKQKTQTLCNNEVGRMWHSTANTARI